MHLLSSGYAFLKTKFVEFNSNPYEKFIIQRPRLKYTEYPRNMNFWGGFHPPFFSVSSQNFGCSFLSFKQMKLSHPFDLEMGSEIPMQ